ncbi:MAG: hypothetical protein KF688_18035 [Pirellulales bacterium]|nr:hypothetical protein [Pirellulales bacterium]
MRKFEITQAHTNGKTYFSVFGRRFGTRDEAVKFADATVKRREQLAGRELDELTMRRGVEHPNDMDARARAAASNWRPFVVETKREVNPFDDVPESSVGDRDLDMARNARKRIYKQAKKDWADREPAPADPKRDAAIEWAEAHLERVMFDPSQPQSAVLAAEQMLRQAKEGDLGRFREMSEAATASLDAQQDERVKAAQSEYDRALQRLQVLKPDASFEGSLFVKPGDKVSRSRGLNGETIEVLRPGDKGNRVMHSWPADEAPEEVAALAPAWGDQ